jgi:hypothetical protein
MYRWFNEDVDRENETEIVSLTHALYILVRLAYPEYFTNEFLFHGRKNHEQL